MSIFNAGFLKKLTDWQTSAYVPISLIDTQEIRDTNTHSYHFHPISEGEYSSYDLRIENTLDAAVRLWFSWADGVRLPFMCTDGTTMEYDDSRAYHRIPSMADNRRSVALSELPLKLGSAYAAGASEDKTGKTPVYSQPWKKFTLTSILEDELGTTNRRVYLSYMAEETPTTGNLNVIFIGKK